MLSINMFISDVNVHLPIINFCLFQDVNPLNPGQFTRRVYCLPAVIRDNVPVSVSVFWQRKFR